jgi:dethiobiotin synthetase
MRGFQIAGAHTDVGKTYVACALLRAARAKGLSVSALKPVVSGFQGRDWAGSDPGLLITAMGQPLTPRRLEEVSPLRFAAPLSPPMAARREGRSLRLDDLLAISRPWLEAAPAEFGILETAGGVMSPMAEDGLCLDLMTQVSLPVLLVGGGYLGAISHNLTALSVLAGAGLTVRAMVVSESADPEAPAYDETVGAIAQWSGDTPVIAARRGDEAWAVGLV